MPSKLIQREGGQIESNYRIPLHYYSIQKPQPLHDAKHFLEEYQEYQESNAPASSSLVQHDDI
jgi:hypothetical protein